LPVFTDERLLEVALGPWEDKPWGEVMEKDAECFGRFVGAFHTFDNTGAERGADVLPRMLAAFDEFAARHAGQSVAAVSHGMALRELIGHLHGLPRGAYNEHCDNASVTTVSVDAGGRAVVVQAGENAFLGELSTFSKQHWWREGGGERDAELWFSPLAGEDDVQAAVARQAAAWQNVYGTPEGFSAQACAENIRALAAQHPRCAQFVMRRSSRAGLLLLSPRDSTDEDGHITSLLLDEEYTGAGMGLQLLGEAVSFYRGTGKAGLRLRVRPQNTRAAAFYRKHGFVKCGEYPGYHGPLDVLRRPMEI
jgi:probable phosphoglycerate mutase